VLNYLYTDSVWGGGSTNYCEGMMALDVEQMKFSSSGASDTYLELDDIRYTLQESTDTSDSVASCSKTTGLYSPQYLSTCLEAHPLESGYYEIYYDLSSYNQGSDQFTICDESTSTSPYDYASLNAMMVTESDVCGPYSIAPCLLASPRTCTLGSDTGCRYDTDTSTVYFYYTVDLTTPVWTLEERNELVLPESGSMRVFSCSSKRRRRDEAASADVFESLRNETLVEQQQGISSTSRRLLQIDDGEVVPMEQHTGYSNAEATGIGSKIALFLVSLGLLAVAMGYSTLSYINTKRKKSLVIL